MAEQRSVFQRFVSVTLIGATVAESWLAMMLVHELGHIVGAWWTGGTVARVVLHPLAISRTDLAWNPCPLLVAWSGPMFGILLPFAAWLVAWTCRVPGAFVLRFFAGFCLLANGAYIGVGSFRRVGDAGDLLRTGAAIWQLWLFAVVACPAGLLLWHRLGSHFGLGPDARHVDGRIACLSLILLVLLVIYEVWHG